MKKIQVLRFFSRLIYLAIFITGIVSKDYRMLFIITTAFLLGPIFCGWMCFTGFYQDIARYLGRFIKKEPWDFDKKIHNKLRYLRYIGLFAGLLLGGIFLFPEKIGHSLGGVLKGHLVIDTAFYFLIALGILSLVTSRFFCRYCCPFGAKLGLYSLFRPITINRNENCIHCGGCTKACPMGIEVDKINSMANPNCINCFNCIENCPQKSLAIRLRNFLKP